MAELLYEGKAKQVYKTDKEDEYLIHYKDDATAGNGVKHDQFEGKGVLNNTISCIIFDMLEEAGIKTHMIKKLNDRDVLVKKVEEPSIERHPVYILGTDYKVKIIYKNVKVPELDLENKTIKISLPQQIVSIFSSSRYGLKVSVKTLNHFPPLCTAE